MQYAVSFGRLDRIQPATPGPAFRIAILGDFSGRANAGIAETGMKLAARKPHKLDVDNLDNLIERLNITVSVPIDEDGNVLTAPIKSLDDFHPDQLIESLPVFEALLGLRRNLQSRAGFDRAAKEVLSWSDEMPLPQPATRRSRASAVPTDRRLSDFARLTGRAQRTEADADELMRRLVGPFIVPSRDSRQDALLARVDAALSAAMRRVLHHPDFQAAESLWRGLDFLTRRIETGARLQIVLYDISAEELAADLAATDRLEDTGLYSLLVEQPAQDAGQGPLSVLASFYHFEPTPPHADLLGRIAQLAAAAGAPFIAGISPDALKIPVHDWHPLTRQAWEALRALPASAYLGLNTPRFLLRMPYGKRTDPIDAFAFEEFTRESGLSGMLWGHPTLLTATLLAQTWQRNPKAMQLGSIANVGDLPVYVYHDTDGEQIALPCTERLLSERNAAQVASTGVNPVVSLRGRPEVRVGGFRSLAGGDLAGRWAPVDIKPAPPQAPAPPPPAAAPTIAPPPAAPPPAATAPTETAAEPSPEPAQAVADTSELDALLSTLETPTPTEPAPAADDELDSLLASLNVEPPPAAEGSVDSELDALLDSLK